MIIAIYHGQYACIIPFSALSDGRISMLILSDEVMEGPASKLSYDVKLGIVDFSALYFKMVDGLGRTIKEIPHDLVWNKGL